MNLPKRKGHILQQGHRIKECGALKYHGTATTHRIILFLRQVGYVSSIQKDSSRIRPKKTHQVFYKNTLPDTTGPHNVEDTTRIHG